MRRRRPHSAEDPWDESVCGRSWGSGVRAGQTGLVLRDSERTQPGVMGVELTMSSEFRRGVVLVVMVGMFFGFPTIIPAEESLRTQAQKIFQPLPRDMSTAESSVTPEKVGLGRVLFFEPRFSSDGTVSCARCHQPALYGTDALPRSIGVEHRVTPRNAPTVLNAALQFVAHWRGDRKSVEDQATQALVGPASTGHPNYQAAMARLKAIPGYVEVFRKAFPGEDDPVTPENFGRAVGAYERTLVTPSRFDAFLTGDDGALSGMEQAGLHEFIQVGCATCHNGVGVGGGLYRKFGLLENYWEATGSPNPDKGRFDVTHEESDLYVFRVPSLRNVVMTPPYFHDGSVPMLREAVRIMAKVQLGQTPSEVQTERILAFLGSLTGTLPPDFTGVPVLPPAAFQRTEPGR